LSSLWPPNPYADQLYANGMKFPPDLGMEFTSVAPLDMEFNPSISIRPKRSNTNGQSPFPVPSSESHHLPTKNFLSTSLSLSHPMVFHSNNTKPRRLSITSSSSRLPVLPCPRSLKHSTPAQSTRSSVSPLRRRRR
jgi:hypothetical protein